MLIWSVLLIPGPIYSMWRRMGKSSDCPHCHLPGLVKLESDAGSIVRRKFDVELGLIKPQSVTSVEDKKAKLEVFGNEKPSTPQGEKKPVNPDKW